MIEPLQVPALPALPLDPEGSWSDVAGASCGVAVGQVKKPESTRDDVVVLRAPGAIAGVTTRSSAAAAPCRYTRALLPGQAEAILINSGNANAATGQQGFVDVARSTEAVAEVLACDPQAVLVCSTGVIGVPMPMERMLPAVREAAANLGPQGARAARAILTTDLVAKEVALRHGGVHVAGMAKGSGMIHPNMATMLAFLVTDAQVHPEHLQALIAQVSEESFNAITVDGDCSTNDTFLVQATGAGLHAAPGTPAWEALREALRVAAIKLARDIARDGEGATNLVECVVMGLADDQAARRAARAVLRSSLVKAAIHGRDPNWGRVVGALGAEGVPDLEQLDLDLAGVPVLRAGRPLAFDEARASAALEAPEVQIACRLPGRGLGRAWGCDLSADYVKINADYRS
ncbi:MAG: bifunctional glutamate N-acetyltransferase/amino-acid acetyltransferase ArgJ [Alphaproteobacteria bacterium]|nr:bifunctional glutamate N-acetyltransferase/amino-acid acetyltransferase ArgJ [Alphaproteobacteria bacterium]MCB9796902.1 bifunctional glutamate N-acetyltransferase/amino-acid acetyltransferase ArgJ [Alphaproteobacteria bacterium]